MGSTFAGHSEGVEILDEFRYERLRGVGGIWQSARLGRCNALNRYERFTSFRDYTYLTHNT